MNSPTEAVWDDASAKGIVNLDRKISRAMERERGVTLSPAELDLLAAIGCVELLSQAKGEALVAKAQARLGLSLPRKGETAPGVDALSELVDEASMRRCSVTAAVLAKQSRRRLKPPR